MIEYKDLLEQIGNEAVDKVEDKTIKDNLDYWSFVVNRVGEILSSDQDYNTSSENIQKLYKKTFFFRYAKKIDEIWDISSKASLNQNEPSTS